MVERAFLIAGVSFLLELPDASAEAVVCRGLLGFEGPSTTAHRIRVEFGAGAELGGPRAMPRLDATKGGYLVRGEDFEAHLSPGLEEAVVRCRPGAFAAHSVMKLLLAAELAKEGGVVCHGVALARSGQAALFVGDSGAGKSTLGAFAVQGGLARLSDELVVLRPKGSGFRAESTPWNIGAPGSARLVALGTLGWDSAHRIDPAPPAEVLRVLLGNVLLPFEDAVHRHQLFANVDRVLRATPSVRLFFARDPGVAAVLCAQLLMGQATR